jgi:hypothetical protein
MTRQPTFGLPPRLLLAYVSGFVSYSVFVRDTHRASCHHSPTCYKGPPKPIQIYLIPTVASVSSTRYLLELNSARRVNVRLPAQPAACKY